jgi:acyl carrier protein
VGNRIDFEDFKLLVADQLGVEDSRLSGETTFSADLGIDSLSLVNFVITMEKQYGIKVEMDAIFSMKNLRDAYETFTAKMEPVADMTGKGVKGV